MSLRGISSRNESRDFFYPDIHHLHDPFLMMDMDKAVEEGKEDVKEARKKIQ